MKTFTEAEEQRLQLKIEEYSDKLYRLAFLKLQNRQDAEDAVQETFFQYICRTEDFISEEHEKAWLYKVLINYCRKTVRCAWYRHRDGAELQETDTGGEPPEQEMIRREQRRELREQIWKLPEKYREVLHLFYFEDLSVKEIAGITGRGESSVTSLLTRGRKRLKELLGEEYQL